MAMLRNMVTSLIFHERIMTTTTRAKELRRIAEKMVQHAKIGTFHHRRLAGSVVRTIPAVTKLFEILGPRYMDRPGGYTRIMKLAKPRRGDSAEMAYIEFVDREGELRKAKPGNEPFQRTVRQQVNLDTQGKFKGPKGGGKRQAEVQMPNIEEVD